MKYLRFSAICWAPFGSYLSVAALFCSCVDANDPPAVALIRAEQNQRQAMLQVEAPPNELPTEVAAIPFRFLSGPGRLNAAFRIVWEENHRAVKSSQQASDSWALRAEAESELIAHRPEAQRILLSEYKQLRPSDVGGYAEMDIYLDIVGSNAPIREHLQSLLLQSQPSRGSDENSPVVRQIALGHLITTSNAGDKDAQGLVLAAVKSPDPAVQAAAIRGVYAIYADRRTAQRALRRILPVHQQHLLYTN